MTSHVSVVCCLAYESSSTYVTVTVAAGVHLHVLCNTTFRCVLLLTFVARENLVCRLCAKKLSRYQQN